MAIPFVDLSRHFAPVDENEEKALDIGRLWGPRIGGWFDWDSLLAQKRVVLLAEADSGKTQEFRAQVRRLHSNGEAAFFARIEDIADHGLTDSFDDGPSDVKRFIAWRDEESEEAWFFLDSIDEARLNGRRFDGALRRLGGELGSHRDRAHIFVSCRVSDWRGQDDREVMQRYLPAQPTTNFGHHVDVDPLLDPIFLKERQDKPRATSQEHPPHELLTVRIVPLDNEQRRSLARAAGILNEGNFVHTIFEQGLASLADRPGDLIELATYWKDNGEQFASLAAMVDHAVETKLRDKPDRPDGVHLAPEDARRGAERLAAALTLAKTFALKSGDGSSAFASGALDPTDVLPDWNDAKRAALLRRGVFAPSTYSRVRFHHRSTQEYLAASWFKRLLDAGCPKHEIHGLLFAEPYGMKTVVPSLRAATAWFALHDRHAIEEVLTREPLILVQHGDPRSLTLDVRQRLLLAFADKDAQGEIADDSLDHQRLSLFADPSMGSAIRKAWYRNDRSSFRSDLLRLIREGRINECVDLASAVALDDKADEYARIHAVDALAACEDRTGLEAIAAHLRDEPNPRDPFASRSAEKLFPQFMDVEDLLDLMRRTGPPPRNSTLGFQHMLSAFWELCPDDGSRIALCEGLGRMCLEPPYSADHQRVSTRFCLLAGRVHSIARTALLIFGDALEAERLVPLLMVAERSRERDSYDDEPEGDKRLDELLDLAPRLKQKLFWADVEEVRRNEPKNEVVDLWDFSLSVEPMWKFGPLDCELLEEALRTRGVENDRRLALAILIRQAKMAEKERSGVFAVSAEDASRFRALIAERGGEAVEQDLANGLRPPPPLEPPPEWSKRQEERRRRERAREAVHRKSWVDFRTRLITDPAVLRDRTRLVDFGSSAQDLWTLTTWLRKRMRNDNGDTALRWPLIEEGFSRAVADAYRDGMMSLWRLTEPTSPIYGEDNQVFRDRPTILAFAALGIEAAENPDWAGRLTPAEVTRAARHAHLADEGYPLWFEALVEAHPTQALAEFRAMARAEWSATKPFGVPIFWRYSDTTRPVPDELANELLELMIESAPASAEVAAYGLPILAKVTITSSARQRLRKTAAAKFDEARRAGDLGRAVRHFAYLFLLDPNASASVLQEWLDEVGADIATHGYPPAAVMVPVGIDERGRKRSLTVGERLLADLFGRHDSLIPTSVFEVATVPTIIKLLELAHRFVRREDDVTHEGTFSPGTRDNAETARSALFNALLQRRTAEAYSAMRSLADLPGIGLEPVRLAEIAHGMAERDAEPPAWTAREVVSFEKDHVLPAKTGSDLMRLVLGVLADMAADLAGGRADTFPRSMVAGAEKEEDVQQWLAHELQHRAKGRYSVYREVQIAKGDKPDTLITSTAAPVEVAIELKHANKDWTVADLEKALEDQLAERYLKTDNRRHGILVMSMHRQRTWRTRDATGPLDFSNVIARLAGRANRLETNSTGPIAVSVVGLDARGS